MTIRTWPMGVTAPYQLATEKPCTYWSHGKHIVPSGVGVCRCGRMFEVMEVVNDDPVRRP